MKRFTMRTFVLIAFLGLVCGWDSSNKALALRSAHLQVENLRRNFIFYVPNHLAATPKLIFVLHGSGMSLKGMEVLTGYRFEKLADRDKDLIVVYPEGYKRYWNDCRRGGTYDAKKLNVDDASFFEAMVKYFKDNFDIDEKNVFATGYSNGAQMCFKLAKTRPDLFKGLAAVCANLPTDANDDCTASGQPVSILMMNGTSDPINPYNGGLVKAGDGKQRGEVVSTDISLHYWLALNKADTSLVKEYDFPDVEKNDRSTAVQYSYESAQTGKRVVLIKVINGGHIFMNTGFHFWSRSLGNVNKDISAPEVILDFFRSLK